MSRVISIHEYSLKPGVDEKEFEQAVRSFQEKDLLRLPGLVEYHMLKGIRGWRTGLYAIVWVYESKEAWEKLWGPLDEPLSKQDYPENWKIWENEVLAPFLDCCPDEIRFTSYIEW